MLWNLIRDFFVQHVFGGVDSLGRQHLANIGYTFWQSDSEFDVNDLGHVMYPIGYEFGSSSDKLYLSASDWLSTTATAISITIIVVLCCLFVYKIIKLIGGLIR